MVGAGGAREQQPHRIAFVTKGGLHANEYVAKLLAVNQQVLAVCIQVARRWPPVLFQSLGIGRQGFVFGNRHAIGNVQLGTAVLGLSIVNHGLHQGFRRPGQVLHVIAVLLQRFHHGVDGTEHIQVGSGTDIALVRGEAKDGDGDALSKFRLAAQIGPFQCPLGDGFDTILQRDRATSIAIATRHDNRFDRSIQFGNGNL